MRHFAILGLWLLAGAVLGSCEGDDGSSSGGDDLGRPCAYDGDCGGGLVCDFHMGLGTCQEDHGHSSTGDSESDASSTG